MLQLVILLYFGTQVLSNTVYSSNAFGRNFVWKRKWRTVGEKPKWYWQRAENRCLVQLYGNIDTCSLEAYQVYQSVITDLLVKRAIVPSHYVNFHCTILGLEQWLAPALSFLNCHGSHRCWTKARNWYPVLRAALYSENERPHWDKKASWWVTQNLHPKTGHP